MSIPQAVSSSVLTPGLYLPVDLVAGTASPGVGTLRIALMATQSSGGDLTDDTEVRTLTGVDSAITAFGTGTVGHLAAKLIYQESPSAIVDAVSPAAGSGSATLDLTFGGAPTGSSTLDFDIMGRTFEVVWLVGESTSDIRDKVIAAVNQRTADLACTASSGGAAVVTLTSKVAGNVGNDILVKATVRSQTGTETLTGAATHTALPGGSSDPDFTNALAALAGREYHFIVGCLSNADAINVAAASNADRLYNHCNTYNTGKSAKLQQFIVGVTGNNLSNLATATPHANGFNNAKWGQAFFCITGRSLPGEFVGFICGHRHYAIGLDPAANIINDAANGLAGSHDKIADQPTAAETEIATGAGISIIAYTAQDQEYIVRSVTAYSQNAAGQPDRRLLDTQNVDAAYIVARDMRDNLPVEFANAKIQEDAAAGEDPPPAGVIEERDIKAFIISRLRFWQEEGVVDGPSLDTIIENNEIIVQVNSSDPTQVDIYVPFEVLQPLAKMGVYAARVPS